MRQQPAEALISEWRQGMNPKAKRPGAVFATVWKRENRPPNQDPEEWNRGRSQGAYPCNAQHNGPGDP